MKKSILFIVGSLREKSLNRQLAERIIEIIELSCGEENGILNLEEQERICDLEGIECEILDFKDIPYMNQDLEIDGNPPESIERIRRKVMDAAGLWIVTPEYNYSYSGLLKNLLDWLSRPLVPGSKDYRSSLTGKKVTISGVGGKRATDGARGKLCELLRFLEADRLELYTTGFAQSEEAMNRDKLMLSAEDQERIKNQVIAFLRFIRA